MLRWCQSEKERRCSSFLPREPIHDSFTIHALELRDLIVTPIIIFIVYALAYVMRPYATDAVTRRYFFPALTLKILGALAVGFLYQFYYGGGDTFMYHTYGSRYVWNALIDSPEIGVKLLVPDWTDQRGVYKYASQIYFFNDPASYAVIKIAAIFDVFTFSSYSATAIMFAILSFAGVWLMYLTFYEQYPRSHRGLAIAVFFIPSVFFWGSGLLKDTVTLGCLGAATFFTYRIFLRRQFKLLYLFLWLLSLYGLYIIKVYILLNFLPAAILWLFLSYYDRIRSSSAKIFLFPIVISGALLLGYLAVEEAGADNAKYSLSMISKTAQVTAYDIRYWSGREAGSGYALGELDGTWQSMLRLAPTAIAVSLFRPYLWEVNNALMLLTALESLVFTVFFIYVIGKLRTRLFMAFSNPTILYCLVFSITFAFAVGVSTFNFGTLARYKIPLMPFFAVALVLMLNYLNKERKTDVLATTE